jgi:DNA mismatch repair protein MutS
MIQQTLDKVPLIKEFYIEHQGKLYALSQKLNCLEELREYLDSAIIDEAPLSRRDGGIFKEGFNEKIDELRKLLYQGKDYILDLQKREIEKTGISNLKISFNKVFGYYIEVSKGKVDLVPEYFIRKQTLTNSERYITPELKEYEDKVLNAEGELKILEDKLFDEVIKKVLTYKNDLILNAKTIAELDLYASFAYLAYLNDYCKPELSEDKILKIENGRHPVVEKLVDTGSFVPNSTEFKSDSFIKLITGPNMGGKSTYLRQTALIILMAQIGSFVPARKAEIGMVDQIYTRVGASDNISRGLSTFMVEMEETAYILRQATEKSLLILDEIGRGTSTYDGVSLAWAILEFLHNEIKPRSLFATHYHELIELAKNMENAENLSVAVQDDGVSAPVFLHKIKKGAVDKSYGVHVATMAGVPPTIVSRANQLLIDLENKQTTSRQHQNLVSYQESLFEPTDLKAVELKEKIEKLDVNNLTPLEALQKLYEIKQSIE